MTFDALMGTAYRLSVLENNRQAAIDGLHATLGESSDLTTEAQEFIAAHEKVPHDRCFITSTRVGLLKAALA